MIFYKKNKNKVTPDFFRENKHTLIDEPQITNTFNPFFINTEPDLAKQ